MGSPPPHLLHIQSRTVLNDNEDNNNKDNNNKDNNNFFFPFSFGGWHSGAVREAKKLGAALAHRAGGGRGKTPTFEAGSLPMPALPNAHFDGVLQSVTFS